MTGGREQAPVYYHTGKGETLLRYVGICAALGLMLLSPQDGFCQPDPSKVIVAEAGNDVITLEDFNLSYSIKFRSNPETAPFEWKEDHLGRIVERMIIAEEARAQGATFDMDEDELTRYKRKMLVQEFYRVYGRPDTIEVQEELIRHEYEMGNFAYRIWSIMVDTRAEAEEILDLLKRGRDFEELSRERGQGVETGTGGDLGWKTWRELELVPELREVAVELKVDAVSDVIESDYGFHVIKLMGKRPNPQLSYAQMWRDIFGTLRRVRVTESMTLFREAFEAEQDVVLNDEAVAVLAAKIDEVGGKGDPDRLEPLLTYRERSQRVVSFKGGLWTIGDFLDYCRMVGQRIPGKSYDYVARFVKAQAINDLLVEEAKRRGLEESRGFKERVRTLAEVSLESGLRGVEVEQKLRITPSMAEEYYSEHMMDFVAGEQVHIRMIVVETRVAADSVLQVLRDGADFAELARVRSLHGGSGQKGGDLGYIHRGRMGGLLDDVAFSLETGRLSEPFPYMGYWGILEVLEKLPARQLTLEEANPQIRRILEPMERDRLTIEWMAGLSEKYGVILYSDRLRTGKERVIGLLE
jgi:parvulin-like peptidyl-prolyl isomerase